MLTPPTACSSHACPNYAVKGGKCADHQSESSKKLNDSYAVKSQKPFFKEYRSARWKKLREARLRGNPICQVIEAGVQCTAPATVCHHLIDPKLGGEAKLWDWTNIVCVCSHHHPGGSEGEKVADRRNFADSIGSGGTRIVHQKYATKTTASAMALSCNLAGLP
jgi:hypothetical protein